MCAIWFLHCYLYTKYWEVRLASVSHTLSVHYAVKKPLAHILLRKVSLTPSPGNRVSEFTGLERLDWTTGVDEHWSSNISLDLLSQAET